LIRVGLVVAVVCAVVVWNAPGEAPPASGNAPVTVAEPESVATPEPEASAAPPETVAIEPEPPPETEIVEVAIEPEPLAVEAETPPVPPSVVEPESVAAEPELAIEAPPPPTETEAEIVAEPPPPPSTAAPAAVASTNPWSHDVPPELERLRRRVHGRRTPTRRDLPALSTYAHDHHSDARPVLLLGHAFARMHWMSEALERYERALSMSPEARGDPDVLPDLVLVASAESTQRAASDLIASTYGADALPAVDAALADAETTPDARERLTTLRARLARRR
jgi:hypothetical protein